jgi:hypothetical protein
MRSIAETLRASSNQGLFCVKVAASWLTAGFELALARGQRVADERDFDARCRDHPSRDDTGAIVACA